MNTIKEQLHSYLRTMGREPALRRTLIDACLGKCLRVWDSEESNIEQIPEIFMSNYSPSCFWCEELMKDDEDLVVQRCYWKWGYFVGHKECRDRMDGWHVWHKQVIDQDCNNCINFKNGKYITKDVRVGFCSKKNIEVNAYPDGTYCRYPLHEGCFQHRKEEPKSYCNKELVELRLTEL